VTVHDCPGKSDRVLGWLKL